MPAYSIVSVRVNDPQIFRQYVDGHKETLKGYGGSFLVATDDFETVEGQWLGRIVVVHRWPDRACFHAWYASDEYRPWKEMRLASTEASIVLVDGLPVDSDEPSA